jgi:excisionase family DNA binding protein
MSLADEIELIECALSVTEVSRLLSLCRASVYRYIDAGIIPAIRIGTTLRIDPRALAQCLRRRTLLTE